MKSIAISVLLLVAAAAYAQVEFYGGDGDGRNGLASEKNGLITGGAWVFEDFDHQGGPVIALWGNFLINYTAMESVAYEIRSNIKLGDGGTLHASGLLTNPTYIPTGRVYFGFTERFIKGGVSIADLPAGRYYLSLQPWQTASGRAFIATCSGSDLGPTTDPNPPPKGTPLKNGNSWFHSAHFAAHWLPGTTQHGAGTWDHSYGVEVPEPGSAALLAVAVLTLVRRR